VSALDVQATITIRHDAVSHPSCPTGSGSGKRRLSRYTDFSFYRRRQR
jgi:hypothetical protein